MITACGTNKENKTTNSTTKQTVTSTTNNHSKTAISNSTKKKESSTQSTVNEKKEKIKDVSNDDDAQKFESAYEEFSLKGNPMPPTQRGDSPRPNGFYESIGLTQEEYTPIFWGIFDYYGYAEQEGLITEDQRNELVKKSQERLKNGDYAKREVVALKVITEENATSYAQQYVDKALGWDIDFRETRVDEDGNFKVYFDGKLANQRGYILITKDGVGSRYANAGGEPLGETLILE